MKKFKVPIKKHISDFICTQNVWLTLNENEMPLHLIKQDSSHELLLGVSRPDVDEQHTLHSKCVESSHPSREFKRIHTENDDSGDFILVDTRKHQLETQLHSRAFWVLFHRESASYTILSEGLHSYKLDKDDFIVVFYNIADGSTLQAILDTSIQEDNISISHLNTIIHVAGEHSDNATPLLLINYSICESYSFSIKSTLNAVSLTIDMIKNKIIKYHREKLWQIETVLHEALVNAITYGNELDDSRLVDISYEIGYKGIRIWVRDTGEGFDVKNISVPVGDEALDRISGRGIYIMKKFTEALYFNHKGNEILLYFDF